MKDLCYGLYGKTAVPINPEVQKKALQGYPRGEEPITCRPAEVLEPELDKAKEEIGELAVDMDDLILYAQFPVTGRKFLEWKYGKSEPPESVKPITLEDVARRDGFVKKAKDGLLVEKKGDTPEKTEALRTFNVFVDNEYFSVEVDPVGGPMIVPAPQQVSSAVAAPSPTPPPAASPPPPKAEEKEPAPSKSTDGTLLLAPMPGMVVSYEKDIGEKVTKGETVVILEAMKMENALPAPCDGVIKANNFSSGDTVAKGAALSVIE